MSNLILPEDQNEENKEVELKYQATEEDEERFFLMYHMSFQPSEVEKLSTDYRRWIIARFMAQKNMEREMIERNRLLNTLGPDLKNGPPNLKLHKD